MAIIVELPAALRRFAGNASFVEVARAGTVADALSELASQHPKLRRQIFSADSRPFGFIGIFLNGEDIRPTGIDAEPVKAGDVITLVPAVAGG